MHFCICLCVLLLQTLAVYVLAYPCVAVVTERWMVLGAHGSPERHADPSSCLSAHQWRMASHWADGTAESYSQQFRRQGHRPALPSSTSSSSSFNLAVLYGTEQRNARSVWNATSSQLLTSDELPVAKSFCLSHTEKKSHNSVSFV